MTDAPRHRGLRGLDADALVERLLEGDRRALARLITLAENRDPVGREAVKKLFPRTGRAAVLGVTGPPGSGKSTLVDRLIDAYRNEGKSVGVVAVDPTSPFTGGAILGDRIRMTTRGTDPEVFIRSMGSRGNLGGLSRATMDTVRILDAAGKDVVIIETVGVGQAEVDIVRTADTVCVVHPPGLGDSVQNTKAGIMEIADVFVVNKADREGADRTLGELEAWLELAHGDWYPPIVATVASTGEGIPGLTEAIAGHRDHLQQNGRLEERRRRQAEHELLDVIRHEITRYVLDEERALPRFRSLTDQIAARKLDPYTAAESILDGWNP